DRRTHNGYATDPRDESGCMRWHWVTLNGRITEGGNGSRLCAYADRIRFRTDRNRPDVTDIDVVSAVLAQIRACKKPSPVFWSPWVRNNARRPSAVLKFPLSVCLRLALPTAVFESPRVRSKSAPEPTATLRPPAVLL